MTYQPWIDLQAKCDELCQRWLDQQQPIDLTTTGAVDVREEHDPISGAVLEESAA